MLSIVAPGSVPDSVLSFLLATFLAADTLEAAAFIVFMVVVMAMMLMMRDDDYNNALC
jgi:hypothetical protein